MTRLRSREGGFGLESIGADLIGSWNRFPGCMDTIARHVHTYHGRESSLSGVTQITTASLQSLEVSSSYRLGECLLATVASGVLIGERFPNVKLYILN